MPIKSKQQPPYYTPGVNTKTYKALLNQTGTNAPIATILKNTYDTTPLWSFSSTGYFIITATGELDPTKTIIQITPASNTKLLAYQEEDTGNSFAIIQNDYAGSSVNGMINQSITITTEI